MAVIENLTISKGDREYCEENDVFNRTLTSGTLIVNGGQASSAQVFATGYLRAYARGIVSKAQIWGSMTVSSGAVTKNAQIFNGGKFYNDYGGDNYPMGYSAGAYNTVIANGGYMSTYQATDIGTTVLGGATLDVGGYAYYSSYGITSKTNVLGTLNIEGGALSYNATVGNGGKLNINKDSTYAYYYSSHDCATDHSQIAHKTVIKRGGGMFLGGSALASNTTISAGGSIWMGGGAHAKNMTMNGIMEITGSNAEAYSVTLGRNASLKVRGNAWVSGLVLNQNGGKAEIFGAAITRTTIANGATLLVSNGGQLYNATVNYRGNLIVSSGSASGVSVNAGAIQTIKDGGSSLATTVNKGGKLIISKGGMVDGLMLKNGAALVVNKGGVIKDLTMSANATLTLKSGEIRQNLTVGKGANLNLMQGFSDSGEDIKIVQVNASGVLELGGKNNLFTTQVTLNGGKLIVNGSKNGLNQIYTTNAKTSELAFNISTASPDSKYVMLASSEQSSFYKTISINASRVQKAGTYSLSNYIEFGKTPVLYVNGKKAGNLGNNRTLTVGGMKYTFTNKYDPTNCVTVSAVQGAMKKGSAKNDTLKGTGNCDIFYGGNGNDKINGVNGQDIVVYDTKNWGTDTIQKSSGGYVILFNGLSAKNISQTKKNGDMILTRKGGKKESITIKGWSDTTHRIVYGGTMKQFNKYVNVSKPSASLTKAVRKEVMGKAGLLA